MKELSTYSKNPLDRIVIWPENAGGITIGFLLLTYWLIL
jgi:hypothetical protein